MDRLQILKNDRRTLHRIPEIDFELSETIFYIKSRLEGLNCEISYPVKGAICAFFNAGGNDCLAFRADMDALPICENTGAVYASKKPGSMHACGHDGHMSMLLSLADVVNERLFELPHNVLLIFQPAEETTGGARLICESGILQKYRVSSIFGFHLWPGLPAGEIRSKEGAVMARTSEVHVQIKGKSAHVARAGEGRDALYAAVRFLYRAYELSETQEPLSQTRLLKFGCMQSGSVQNAISDISKIGGTLRAYDDMLYERLRSRLFEIAGETENETGCEIKLNITQGYPPVINDTGLYKSVKQQLAEHAPLPLSSPSLTGEDFSFYQAVIPGLFFFLGTGRDAPLHSDRFDFEEEALLSGLEMYERLLFLVHIAENCNNML